MSQIYTSYERVKTALEHKEPDRIPFDLGGSVLTGMNKNTYINLRKYLGMPEKDVEIYDVVQQLARIDEDMIDRLNIDVRCVDPSDPSQKGLARDVEKNGDYYELTDEWGIQWKMPVNKGHYFDMQKRPLAFAETVGDIENFPWPDPLDDSRLVPLQRLKKK